MYLIDSNARAQCGGRDDSRCQYLSNSSRSETSETSEAHGGNSCGVRCGTERWSLKTLTDSGAATVAKATPTKSSVPSLMQKQALSQVSQSTRVAPIKNQQFTVEAVLIALEAGGWTNGRPGFSFGPG